MLAFYKQLTQRVQMTCIKKISHSLGIKELLIKKSVRGHSTSNEYIHAFAVPNVSFKVSVILSEKIVSSDEFSNNLTNTR